MKRSEILFGVLRVPADALAVFAALLFAYRLRELRIDLLPGIQLLEPATSLPEFSLYITSFALPGTLVFLGLAALLRLYVLRTTESAWSEVGRVVIAAALWLVLVIAWYFLIRKQLFYSRALLVHAVFFIGMFSLLVRIALILCERSLLHFGIGQRLVVSVGRHPLARPADDVLRHDVHYRYLGHLETLESFERLAERKTIDLVLQTDPDPGSTATLALIDYCRSNQIGYGFLPPVLADVPHQLRVERLGLLPLVQFRPTPLDGWGRVLKRGFDGVLSAALIVILLPVLLLIAMAIIMDSGWPVLFVSPRIGELGRKRIPVLKFRTMRQGADLEKDHLRHLSHRKDGPLFKVRNDPRVTKIGRILRRFSLDELPQLFNVFLGQMSLVGPRPHLPEEVARYSPFERRVFAVKSGVTGLAQVSGRSNLPFADEVRLDLRYIEEWSLLLDVWILWRTVLTVLSRRGAD